MGILPGYPRTFRHKSLILESLLDIDKITLFNKLSLLDIDKTTTTSKFDTIVT